MKAYAKDKKEGSNKVMNAFQWASFKVFDNRFKIRGDVVSKSYRYNHVPLGEILFTILCRSSTDTGIGFNSHPPGIQIDSRNKLSQVQWDQLAYEIYPFVMRNFAAERVRIEAAKVRCQKVKEEIAAAKVRRAAIAERYRKLIADMQDYMRRMRLFNEAVTITD